jgi:small subunit ribosomal protein S21
MLIVKIEKGKSLDSALKELKGKVAKTKMVKELRDRQSFTKKSVKRREEVKEAIWKQSLNQEEN